MQGAEAPIRTSEPTPRNALMMLWEKVDSIEDFNHWSATELFPKDGLKLNGRIVGLGLMFDPSRYQGERDHILEMERPSTGPGTPEYEEFSRRMIEIERKMEKTGTAGIRITDIKNGELRRRDILIRREVDEIQYGVVESDSGMLSETWYVFNPPKKEFERLFEESPNKRTFNSGELDEIVGLVAEVETVFKNQPKRVC